MVHIPSTVLQGPKTRPAALGWGLGVSVGLHLLLLWPSPVKGPQQTPVASNIRAELRVPTQVVAHPSSERPSPAPSSVPPNAVLDSRVASRVPKPSQTRPSSSLSEVQREAAAPSRQLQPKTMLPLTVPGDALTRYRLGLAWQLGRDAVLRQVGSPARPVTVELAVVLAAGRAIGVEVVDDGGFSTLASRVAVQVRLASRIVPVPPELGESPLRVSLALRFEP